MGFEWLISLRYLKSKRRSSVSLITVLSIFGVMLGVSALIIVLSIMGGFATDLREKIVGTKGHVVIDAEARTIENPERVIEIVRANPDVVGISAYVQTEVIVSTRSNVDGVVLRGIDIETIGETSNLPNAITDGLLEWLSDPAAATAAGQELDRELQRIRDRRGNRDRGDTGGARSNRGDAGTTMEQQLVEVEALRQQMELLNRQNSVLNAEIHGGRQARFTVQFSEFVAAGEPLAEGWGGSDPDPDDAYEPTPDEPHLDNPPPDENLAAEDLVDHDPTDEGSGSGFIMPPIPGQGPTAEGTGSGFVMPAIPGQSPSVGPETDGSGSSVAPPSPNQSGLPGDRPTMSGIDTSSTGRQIPGIVIGRELADRLFVTVGDEITLVIPDGRMLPTGPAPDTRPFVVVGTFFTGLYELDMRYAYIDLDEARDLLRLEDDAVTAIDIKASNINRANDVEEAISGALASAGIHDVVVRSWEKLNKGLFAALKLEKIALFVVLSIIILVASFSIVSSLIIMAVERASEIAIMKSMGATRFSIMKIFAIEGSIIGGIGALIGVILGVGGCLAIKYGGLWQLDTKVYYILNVPVDVDPVEVLLTAFSAVLISLLATIYPAMKAASLNPVDGLRYS